MTEKGKKLLCGSLAAVMLLAGCSENSGGGNINTVDTPAGFTGNVGDVTIESGDTYAVITIQGFGSITCKLFPEAAPVGVQNFIDLANSGYYSGKEIHRVISDFMLQGGSKNGDGMSTEDDPSFGVEYNTNMRHFYGALCYANAGGINGSQFYIVNNKSYSPVSEATIQSQLDQLDDILEELNFYISGAASEDEKEYYQSLYNYYNSMKGTYSSQLKAAQELTDEMRAKYEEVGGAVFLDGGYTVFGQTVDGFDVIDKVSAVEVEANSSGEQSHPVQKIVIESVEIFTAE